MSDVRFDKVREIVADCLQLELDEVRPESRLFTDLGADSLDYVEMVFNLEGEFDVKFGDGDLGYLARLNVSDPEVVRDGFVTEATLERVRPWLAGLDQNGSEARFRPADLWGLVTVGTLATAIERMQQAEAGGDAR